MSTGSKTQKKIFNSLKNYTVQNTEIPPKPSGRKSPLERRNRAPNKNSISQKSDEIPALHAACLPVKTRITQKPVK